MADKAAGYLFAVADHLQDGEYLHTTLSLLREEAKLKGANDCAEVTTSLVIITASRLTTTSLFTSFF